MTLHRLHNHSKIRPFSSQYNLVCSRCYWLRSWSLFKNSIKHQALLASSIRQLWKISASLESEESELPLVGEFLSSFLFFLKTETLFAAQSYNFRDTISWSRASRSLCSHLSYKACSCLSCWHSLEPFEPPYFGPILCLSSGSYCSHSHLSFLEGRLTIYVLYFLQNSCSKNTFIDNLLISLK